MSNVLFILPHQKYMHSNIRDEHGGIGLLPLQVWEKVEAGGFQI